MGVISVLAAKEKRPQDWNAEAQLVVLHETHGLSGEALHAWCRENGLFANHPTGVGSRDFRRTSSACLFGYFVEPAYLATLAKQAVQLNDAQVALR